MKSALLLAACVALLLIMPARIVDIERGPYLQIPSPTATTVRWRTDTTNTGRVWFGASPGSLSSIANETGSATDHEVRLTGLDLVTREITLPDLLRAMAFHDIDLATDGLQAFGDAGAIGAGLEDEDILGGGVPRRPGHERVKGLAGDAVADAGVQRIAPREDRGGEAVGMDVQADGPAFGAERRGRWIGGLRWSWLDHRFLAVMFNRRRGRAAVNRSQAGIRSRRRRLGVVVPPRASGLPLQESSSDAQSAKTGSNPTAAHGLSAARLLKEWVFQFSQKTSTTRPRLLSISFTPTYPQRTAPGVTPAASTAAFPPAMQVPRRTPLSLSLRSLIWLSYCQRVNRASSLIGLVTWR